MSAIEIILIAVGLSMDAFAVSVTLGISAKKPSVKEYLLPGAYFGFFQALMPLIGYLAGMHFADMVQSAAHWVAFILLSLIGAKGLASSRDSGQNKCKERQGSTVSAAKMFALAIATSIDALAIGVTFSLFKINIVTAIAVIGIITFAVSIMGVKIGSIFGAKFKSKAEFIGGAVLIGLGVKILVEHLVL